MRDWSGSDRRCRFGANEAYSACSRARGGGHRVDRPRWWRNPGGWRGNRRRRLSERLPNDLIGIIRPIRAARGAVHTGWHFAADGFEFKLVPRPAGALYFNFHIAL